MAFYLAFYLTIFLTFYLAFYPASILTFYLACVRRPSEHENGVLHKNGFTQKNEGVQNIDVPQKNDVVQKNDIAQKNHIAQLIPTPLCQFHLWRKTNQKNDSSQKKDAWGRMDFLRWNASKPRIPHSPKFPYFCPVWKFPFGCKLLRKPFLSQ